MRGFLSDFYLRPSCYACRAKDGASHSDLTIADFWGIQGVSPEFDDDKGVGLVLLNTPKGAAHFHRLAAMDQLSSTLQAVYAGNGSYRESATPHPKRPLFFSLFSEGRSVKEAVDICLHIPLWHRAIGKARGIAGGMARRVLGEEGAKVVKKMIKAKA